MKKIVVITPPDARHGFALAGVRQLVAVPADVPGVLQGLMAEPGNGVVIVDERIVEGRGPSQVRELERRWPGVVIVMPAPERTARSEEDYVLQLIRRAIGYQVRLSP